MQNGELGVGTAAQMCEEDGAGFSESRNSFWRGVTNCRGTNTRKMSFASDKLYNGYLRNNMSTIVSRVKVREIMVHLPCLTPHDRENIEAKRETCGNYDSMALLLDCLRRRENWPEQFIGALEACEHTTLAAAIRAEYDSLRGVNNSDPSSLPTTVVRAHVHPAPPAGPLSVPESGAGSQAAVAPPAEEPAARASAPPLETPAQPQVPEAAPPPEAPQSTQVEVAARPSTPPASPGCSRTPVPATPPPQREMTSQREPEENSESDIQDVSGGNGVTSDEESGEESIDRVADPQPAPCETDTPPRPGPRQTTTTSTEVRPPQSPSPSQINSDVSDGDSFLTLTPERPPVQDTTPPVVLKPAVVLQPEETSEPPTTQVVESGPQTEPAAPPFPPPGAAGIAASLRDDDADDGDDDDDDDEDDDDDDEDDDICLSKPGQLLSFYSPNNGSPAVPAPSTLPVPAPGVPVQPYSGDSDRLELSAAVTSARPPAPAPPCQENGISLNHNEPEENQYDSLCQSLEMNQVMTHVVHVSGEPSILDLDGQSPNQAQFFNGEAATESVNNRSGEERQTSEPAPADISPELKTPQDSEKKKASGTQPANTKYILTAAGVCACALLLAWRFRK